jgi:hypothetical protein
LISVIHLSLPFLSSQIEISKKTIADGKLTVNNRSGFESVSRGKINIDPNHPAEMFENQLDKTNNESLSKNKFIIEVSLVNSISLLGVLVKIFFPS